MFTDVFPATIADSVLNNAPTNVGFTLFGPAYSGPSISTNPTDPTSGETITSASNTGFQAGFANAASYSTLSSTIAGFGAPNFTNPYHKLNYPTYEEWNLEVERQFGRSTVFDLNTLVTAATTNRMSTAVSMRTVRLQALVPSAPPRLPNPSFAAATEVLSNAISNYNGVTASVVHRSKSLLLQFNYS